MRRWTPLLFAIAAPLPGCSDSATSEGVGVVSDSAGIRIVQNAATTDVCAVSTEPTLDLGLVEGPEAYQFYRVFDAATLSDGRIAIVNQGSSQIRVFGPDGVFQHAFGSEGEGPGEFRDVFQLWRRAGDTLVVGDYRPYRFSTFTAEGEYLGSVTPEPQYINNPNSIDPLSDGSILAADDGFFVSEDETGWPEVTQAVMLHDPSGELVDTLAVLPFGRRGWMDLELRYIGNPLFETQSYVASAGNRVVIGRGQARELELYELAEPVAFETTDPRTANETSRRLPEPTMIIRWEGPDRTVTSEHVDAYRATVEERRREADSDFGRRFAEADLRRDRPIADQFPPHASLTFGLDGDLWVREYPRPGEENPDWLVFSPEGRFQCRATLPFERSWDLYEIGADYILGKEEDELGVEHVQRYGLTRP